MVTAGMAAVLLLAFVKFFPQVSTFFHRIQVHQQMHTDAQTAMDTMDRLLREGKVSTAVICSCNNDYCLNGQLACASTPADPPNSQINFFTLDGHLRRFYWGTDNTLRMDDIASPAVPYQGGTTTTLAHNVTGIMFTGDFRDFSIMNVSLRLDVPWDSSGDPTRKTTMILPTQSVRMITTQ